VIVPVSDAERKGTPDPVILEGFANKPGALGVELSCWPRSPLSVGVGVDWDRKSVWRFRGTDMDYNVAKELPAGTRFSVKVVQGSNKNGMQSTVEDLVVGPVWVLSVSTATDDYELPELSVAARSRIRVLPLNGDEWSKAKGKWMSAEEAERSGQPMFCGMARAFANALCEEEVGGASNLIAGLILVPSSHAAFRTGDIRPLKAHKALNEFSTSGLANGNPWLKAGAVAAQRANNSAKVGQHGVRQRYALALQHYRAEHYDGLREGKLTKPFRSKFHVWDYVLTGPDAKAIYKGSDKEVVPFRVTGVVWGQDLTEDELKNHR
jgi:hypothetical protein